MIDATPVGLAWPTQKCLAFATSWGLRACDTVLMTMARVRRGTELLLSPQSPPATGGLIVLTGLRLLAGLIWLYNVVWKVPPDFGERGRRDLYHFTHLAVEHPVFTPFSWVSAAGGTCITSRIWRLNTRCSHRSAG